MSIQNNEVYGNKGHGIMLHRSSDDGIIRNNTVTDSGSACIALFESFGMVIGWIGLDVFCLRGRLFVWSRILYHSCGICIILSGLADS